VVAAWTFCTARRPGPGTSCTSGEPPPSPRPSRYCGSAR
jgi:hypothetical protein